MGFSAALARLQALNSSNVGALYSYTIRIILEIFVANLKIAVGVNPIVSNGRALGRAEIKLFLPKSDKFSHQVPTCDNCDIKNGGKTSEESWSTLADSDSAILLCILTIAIFPCVSGQRTSCLFLSFFFFFHCSLMKIR